MLSPAGGAMAVVFVAAGLLVASGLAKLRTPGPASRALRAAGLPGSPATVRLLGTVEVASGGAVLAWPHTPSLLALAVLYAAFSGFLAWPLIRHVETGSCGCIGARDVPPSWLHVALDAVAAGVGVWAAAAGPSPDVVRFAWRLPLHGAGFLVGGTLTAYLAYLAVAFLPQLFFAYRVPGSSEGAA